MQVKQTATRVLSVFIFIGIMTVNYLLIFGVSAELSDGYVTPTQGDTYTVFRYYVESTDPNVYVCIDGDDHKMDLYSGGSYGDDYTCDTYYYDTTLSEGNHNYYFYIADGYIINERLPASGEYDGPLVALGPGPVHNINTDEYFDTIQGAIDDVDTLNGHTIFVNPGTYYENIVIDKSIELIGAGKYNTTIDGQNIDDVVKIIIDEVNLCGFRIRYGNINAVSYTHLRAHET